MAAPDAAKEFAQLCGEDNVLSLVVEFDTARILKAETGSLFGAVAETTPRAIDLLRNPPPRFDWVGRPEVTNFLLNVIGETDLRDPWVSNKRRSQLVKISCPSSAIA